MQKRNRAFCAVVAMLSAAGLARAATSISFTGTGDWADQTKWTGGVVPSSPADLAAGPNGANVTVDAAEPTVVDVRWANGGNSTASITVLAGGALTTDATGLGFTIGRSNGATGTVTMSGGSITTLAGSTGDASGILSIGDLTNGTGSATGIFNISGGTVTVGNNYSIGTASNLAPNGGGTVHNPPTSFATGTVTQTGGDIAAAGAVMVGFGGKATYTMSAGSLSQNGTNGSTSSLGRDAFFVARNAYSQGTFTQSGSAAVTISNGLYIADNSNAAGSYTVSGGTLSIAGEIHVGSSTNSAGTAIASDTGLFSIVGSATPTITANSLMADTAGSTLNFSIDSALGTTPLSLVAGTVGGVTFTGNAILSAATNIDVDNISGFVPAPGTSFTLLTAAGGINALPTLVNDSDAFDHATLSIVPNNDGSSSLVVTTFVPEPSCLGLVALAGISAVRRRRN